jgi:hypothetical protein
VVEEEELLARILHPLELELASCGRWVGEAEYSSFSLELARHALYSRKEKSQYLVVLRLFSLKAASE